MTSEVGCIKAALKPLLKKFRHIDISGFSPSMLRQLQEFMHQEQLTVKRRDGKLTPWKTRSRYTINKHIGRILRMLKWAVEREYCSSVVLSDLQAVPGLKRGRTKARETAPVKPVTVADVNAIKDELAPELWGAVQFQLATAARPNEALTLRACDIDMNGPVWVYRPEGHKTEHHGKERLILCGPKAQEIIKAFLTVGTTRYLFGKGDKTQPYQRHSYTVAVRRACLRAGIPVWKPNQLRHTAATEIRKAAGVETVMTVLGHSEIRTSEVYAERDIDSAKAVVLKIG